MSQKKKNSYKIDSFRNPDAETRRLTQRTLARIDTLVPSLQMLGLKPHMKVLDIGSGPGIRTIEIAKYLRKGSITGIDTSQVLLSRAKLLKEKLKLKNVEFLEIDLQSNDLQTNFYDFAYMRLVVQHLPDPVASLIKIKKSLKPGGILFIEETDRDWMMIYPHPKSWPELYEKVKNGQARMGGDPRSGRKLPDLLRQAGFKVAASNVIPVHGHGKVFEDWIENYALTFFNNLLAKEINAAEKVIKEIRKLNRKKPIHFSQLWFQAAGKKVK